MALSVEITRDELALANLELNAGNYRWSMSDLQEPGVIWDRREVSSPYVVGHTLVSRKKAMVQQQARLLVTGSTPSNLRGNVDTVVQAVSQFSFSLIFDPDSGSGWTWTCDSADYHVPGEMFQRDVLITEIFLSFPRRPDPFAGSLF